MNDSPGAAAKSQMPTHLDLKLPEQELHVAWADGQRSVFSLKQLRAECPCAACRTERAQREQAALPVLSNAPPEGTRVVHGSLAGNYAIKLVWSDGHDTGIFEFRYLRSLDPHLAER